MYLEIFRFQKILSIVSPKIPRPDIRLNTHPSSPNLLFLPPSLISVCGPIFQTPGFSFPRIYTRKNVAEYKRQVKFQDLTTPNEVSLCWHSPGLCSEILIVFFTYLLVSVSDPSWPLRTFHPSDSWTFQGKRPLWEFHETSESWSPEKCP